MCYRYLRCLPACLLLVVVLFSSWGFFSSTICLTCEDKEERTRSRAAFFSVSRKVKHQVKRANSERSNDEKLRDRATDELRTICIFRDRLRNDLRDFSKILLSSSLDAENAQNAPSFCISLVRSQDENEGKERRTQKERSFDVARNKKGNARRRRGRPRVLSLPPSASDLLRCRSQRVTHAEGIFALLVSKREKTCAIL